MRGLVDRRQGNGASQLVTDALKKAIRDLILRLVGQKIELNAPVLRPYILLFIQSFDNGKCAHFLGDTSTATKGSVVPAHGSRPSSVAA